MDLFKSVRYHPSGVLDDDVSELLEVGGAKYCKYLCGLCKYLIVGKDASDLDIDEALDELKIPAITQDWVRVSANCGKLIPTAAFFQPKEQLMSGERVLHSKDQLLAGVRVCISGVGAKDRSSIWAMVTFHGGKVDTLLNEATTHLVTTVDRGKYYEEALERKDVLVVTPDWVTDSVRLKLKCRENLYHPRLLITSSVASNGIEDMHKEEIQVRFTEETSKSLSRSPQRTIIKPFEKVQSPGFEEGQLSQVRENNAFDSLQDSIIPLENNVDVPRPKMAADVMDGAIEEESVKENMVPNLSPVRTDIGLGLVSMAYLNSSSEEDSQKVKFFPEVSVNDGPVGQPIESEDCAHTKISLVRKRRKQLDWSDFSAPSEKKTLLPSQPTSKKNENKAKKKAEKIEKFKNRMKKLRGRPKIDKTKQPLKDENGVKETKLVRPKRAVRPLPDFGFTTGEPVMALWTNGYKYPAEILCREPDGSYLVQFYDGYKKALRGHLIRRVQPNDQLFIESCKIGMERQTNGNAKPMEQTPEMNIQIERQNESKTPSDWTGSNQVRPKRTSKKRLIATFLSDSDTPDFNVPMKLQKENEQNSKVKKKSATNKTKVVKANKEVVKKKQTELQKTKKQYSKNTKKPITVDHNQDLNRSRRQRSNLQMKLPAESSYLSPSTSQPDSSCTSTMPLTSVFNLLSERKQPLDRLFSSPQSVPHPILTSSSPDTVPSHLCQISTSTGKLTGDFSSDKAQHEEAGKPTGDFISDKAKLKEAGKPTGDFSSEKAKLKEVKQQRESNSASSSSHTSSLFPSKGKQRGDYDSTPLGINTDNPIFTPTKALTDNSSVGDCEPPPPITDRHPPIFKSTVGDFEPPPPVASRHPPIFKSTVGDFEPPPPVASRHPPIFKSTVRDFEPPPPVASRHPPIFKSSVRDFEPPPLVADRHPPFASSMMPPSNASILTTVAINLPQNTQISAVTRQDLDPKKYSQDIVTNQQEFPARELQTSQQDTVPETSEAKKEMSLSPLDWTVEETIDAVTILDKKLASHVEIFRSQEIDGRALLMLDSEMMIKFLDMKVGPALKLSNIIEKLKKSGGNNN